ncbi:uncharacterized protein PV09_03255 [Verruconis gallopava]|uniref:FAD-binding domain-containing protein n=1 Tax=Verruconis gallopava TaxID=253628 RepID=A0A0D2B4D6_9PEZI|nr:uncharacterized protein PV09_03255 [Verruconis gallopava]KIW06084.1 hypothetical protein PV09_03255 [Verruconis gallopava]
MDILILGGGFAGFTTALSLTKFAPPDQIPNITLFEISPEPRTRGGAVNLTPNALRLLDHLGALTVIKENRWGETINAMEVFNIYTGKIAESSFRGPNGKGIGNPPYKALRITRGHTLLGIMEAAEKHPNIKVVFGKKTTKIDETDEAVTLTFSDGSTAKGDILLGCDGIHSVTRLKHVEPERKAVYSGITNAFGYAKRPEGLEVHFECASLNFCQRGMILCSFFEPTHSKVYIGGLMEMEEIADRDGWTAYASEQKQLKADFADRFKGTVLPAIDPLLEAADDFYLWPVFTLSKEGKWATNRTMLLGDAAHAMPPQGESTGIVFEDTVLFARCLFRWVELGKKGTVKDAFNQYEKLRRHRIAVAYDESSKVVATVKDSGWLGHKIKMAIVPWFLWWTSGYRHKHFVEDVTTSDLGF